MPSSSSCISTRVWLSSAPNGSSSSRIFGSLASARAIATRCCMPPESCLGKVILEAAQADLGDEAVADLALLALAGMPFSRRPKQMFWRTFSQGKSV